MSYTWVSHLIPVYGFIVLAIYCSFLYVFAANYKAEFRKYPFYLFVPCLAVGDIGMLLLYSLYLVIYRFVDGQIDHQLNQFVLLWSGLLLTVYTSFLVALNRFTVLLMPKMNDCLFSEQNMKRTILLTFLFYVAVVAATKIFFNCELEFDQMFGDMQVLCNNSSGWLPEAVQQTALYTYQLQPLYFGFFILVIYVTCFVYLVRQRLTNSAIGLANIALKKGKERRLLYQGACIGLSLVILDLMFMFADFLPKGSVALMVITNALVTPLTFIVFNKVIRECYLLWLGWVPKPNRVENGTTTAHNAARKETPASKMQNFVAE